MTQEMLTNGSNSSEVISKSVVIEEDVNMAGTEVITEVQAEVQAVEEKLPKFTDVLTSADEDRTLIVLTSPKYKNTRIDYAVVEVPAGAEVKECVQAVTTDKMINLVDVRNIRKAVETNTALRGMASTIADFTAKYAKVMGVEVVDKTATTITCYASILESIDNGKLVGTIAYRPEQEQPAEEEATADEVVTDTEVVEDPFDVEE